MICSPFPAYIYVQLVLKPQIAPISLLFFPGGRGFSEILNTVTCPVSRRRKRTDIITATIIIIVGMSRRVQVR